MELLIASPCPEAFLHYPDSIDPKNSLQLPPVADMDSLDRYHPSQDASDAELELAIAECRLWLRKQDDPHLSEVLAMGHDELLASALAEMAPRKGTAANPIDLSGDDPSKSTSDGQATGGGSRHRTNPLAAVAKRAQRARSSSTDSALLSPNPKQLERKRKACSGSSERSLKRTKARQSSAMQHETLAPASYPISLYLHKETVFLRLERVFMTSGKKKREFRWDRRIKSWLSGTVPVNISSLFEKPDGTVSALVRPGGDGFPVTLSWNSEEQVFSGRDLEGKSIVVSYEEMEAMHKNPLDGQFTGSRRSWKCVGGGIR